MLWSIPVKNQHLFVLKDKIISSVLVQTENIRSFLLTRKRSGVSGSRVNTPKFPCKYLHGSSTLQLCPTLMHFKTLAFIENMDVTGT